MLHAESLNQSNEDRVFTTGNGVFGWSDFDGEAHVGINHVVNELQQEGIIAYDRADDDINNDRGTNEHHSDDDGNNDDNYSIDDDDDNGNGGGNYGGVQVPNEQGVANGNEVDQPRYQGSIHDDTLTS